MLIVDDEPNIREGLRAIIDWNKLGFEICAEAENGKAAYEQVLVYFPDLCIVDVNMPLTNGLTFVKMLYENKIDTKVIILSGYRDFEYAKTAMQYESLAYLLKPVDEEELNDIVISVKEKLDKQQKQQKLETQNRVYTRDKCFEALIMNENLSENIDWLNSAYQTNLPWSNYQIVLIEVSEFVTDEPDAQKMVYEITKHEVKQMQAGFVFTLGKYIVVLVNQLSIPRVWDMFEFISKKLKPIPISIAISEKVSDINALKGLYERASVSLKYKFFAKDPIILVTPNYENEFIRLQENNNIPIEYYINNIYIAIETAQHERLRDLLHKVCKEMREQHLNEEKIKMTMLRIYISVANEIVKKELRVGVNDVLNDFIYDGIHSANSIFALEDYVFHQLIQISKKNQKEVPNDVLSRLLHFIDCNYHKDIKLEELGEIFGYNSAYLGKLFRNQTGDYFNTYLDKVRIAKAKELLDNTTLKLNDIAEKTGYVNYDYFSTKFKKSEGISPSTYRSMIRG